MEQQEEMPLSRKLQISISADEMKAEIVMIEPMDQIDLQELLDLLETKGISVGIDREQLNLFCEDPQKFGDRSVVIARGKDPTDGESGYVDFLYQSQKVKPAEKEDGSVDFYQVIDLANVSKGQPIAMRVDPCPGVNGLTVTNKTVSFKPGKKVEIRAGKNVVLNENRTLAYAVIDGQVAITEKDKINVFPIYEVKGDVDFRVGNIDFVGNVIVRGNVLSRFKIKASGDILITGSVEGAELEAMGSIQVHGSVFSGNLGFLKAGTDIKARHIQDAIIDAGNDVIVAQSIMYSQVNAGRNIYCFSSKGQIIGGNLFAGEALKANIIGNMAGTVTNIEVGSKQELRLEMVQIKQDLGELESKLKLTEANLLTLDRIGQGTSHLKNRRELQFQCLNQKLATEKRMKELAKRLNELEEEIRISPSTKVEVLKLVNIGVKFTIGKCQRDIKEAYKQVIVTQKNGEIYLSPL